jgi:hypothetical protein
MIPCFVHSSKKFPGYTSEVCLQPLNQPRPRRIGAQLFTHLSRAARFCLQNLSTHGVHEVSQRRFVLVSADHPSKLLHLPPLTTLPSPGPEVVDH